MNIETSVYQKSKPRFNMTGQYLGTFLSKTPEEIAPYRIRNILRYASKRIQDAGFGAVVCNWAVSVSTSDVDCRVDDRIYSVRWQNCKGGYIELVGIHVNKARPILDYGFAIGQEDINPTKHNPASV